MGNFIQDMLASIKGERSNRITINGKSYNGTNVQMKGNTITIDGVVVEDNVDKSITIIVEGDVKSVSTRGSVTVQNNVLGDVSTQGSVTVGGNLEGSISTQGSVKVKGTMGDGNIKTVGSVKVGGRR